MRHHQHYISAICSLVGNNRGICVVFPLQGTLAPISQRGYDHEKALVRHMRHGSGCGLCRFERSSGECGSDFRAQGAGRPAAGRCHPDPDSDEFNYRKRLWRGNRNWNGNNFNRNWNGNNFGNYRNFRRGGNYAASVVAATTGGTTAIEATRTNGMATAITTVSGSRRAPLSPARLSAARSPTATTTIIPGTPAAALTNVGATVVIAPTALGTTRSSPITDRAGRVIRPTADSGPECLPKKPAPRWRGLFARRER